MKNESTVKPAWINKAAGRIFSYATDWNEGRKIWRDEDIENIIEHERISGAEPTVESCICTHNFAAHEHPSEPWMAINGKMLETVLGKCKLCSCHHWRELDALREESEDEGSK